MRKLALVLKSTLIVFTFFCFNSCVSTKKALDRTNHIMGTDQISESDAVVGYADELHWQKNMNEIIDSKNKEIEELHELLSSMDRDSDGVPDRYDDVSEAIVEEGVPEVKPPMDVVNEEIPAPAVKPVKPAPSITSETPSAPIVNVEEKKEPSTNGEIMLFVPDTIRKNIPSTFVVVIDKVIDEMMVLDEFKKKAKGKTTSEIKSDSHKSEIELSDSMRITLKYDSVRLTLMNGEVATRNFNFKNGKSKIFFWTMKPISLGPTYVSYEVEYYLNDSWNIAGVIKDYDIEVDPDIRGYMTRLGETVFSSDNMSNKVIFPIIAFIGGILAVGIRKKLLGKVATA